MNIDQIKKNLNNGVRFNNKFEIKDNPPLYIKKDIIEPIKFAQPSNDDSSDEEEHPQSKSWYTDLESIDIIQPVNITINQLELDKDVYDWRTTTKKGRLSHKNFTQFLKITL